MGAVTRPSAKTSAAAPRSKSLHKELALNPKWPPASSTKRGRRIWCSIRRLCGCSTTERHRRELLIWRWSFSKGSRCERGFCGYCQLSEAVTVRIMADRIRAPQRHMPAKRYTAIRSQKTFSWCQMPKHRAVSAQRFSILASPASRTAAGAFRTGTNMLLGTPIYMSPEQCRGAKNVGDRSDVYALGVMLFEMLAGRPPFETEMPGEYIALHIFQPPLSLRQFCPGTSMSDWNNCCCRCWPKIQRSGPRCRGGVKRLKFLGNLQSDQLGRGPHERSSGPLPEMQPAKPPGPKPDDANRKSHRTTWDHRIR